MKKVLTTALVVLMVASSVFAGFSGSFESQFKADFAGKNYGFLNGTTNKLELTFDKVLKSTENENPVYGKLAAEIAPKKIANSGVISLGMKITEASINGENWSVDIMKMPGVGNFANGFYARPYDKDATKATAQGLANKVDTTNGVTVVYDGWKFGVGMNIAAEGAAKETKTYEARGFETLTAENRATVLDAKGKPYDATKYPDGTVVIKHVEVKTVTPVPAKKELAATFGMKTLAFVDDALKLDAYAGVYATGKKAIDLGFGAKVAFAQDKLSASVGSDVVLNIKDKTTVDADVLVNFKYDFVKASMYYATKAVGMDGADVVIAPVENLLDVQLGVDLKSFDVPLALTVTAGDLVNKAGRGIDLAVSSAFMEGASVGANFGMKFESKKWNAGINGAYTLENVAKFTAGLKLDGADKVATVALDLAAENTTLLENTTLKLAYSSANFLDEKKAAGALTASCAIKF